MERTIEKVEQSMELLSVGDVESALRLSGEALAEVDAAVSKDKAQARYLCRAAATHIYIMNEVGMSVDAFACGVMSCCMADYFGYFGEEKVDASSIFLLKETLLAALRAVDTLGIGEEVIEKGTRMVTLIACMLKGCVERKPGELFDEKVDDVEELLEMIGRNCVLDGAIYIDGEEVSRDNTRAILAEVVKIAVELQLLQM
ncbi:MAG: hypothetical protein ACI31C_08005 [Muribaculaceae bacterium]